MNPGPTNGGKINRIASLHQMKIVVELFFPLLLLPSLPSFPFMALLYRKAIDIPEVR
jgi:hypothetical protein